MRLEIDRVAIWSPINFDGLSVRTSPPGRQYVNAFGIIQVSDKPMTRYAKNYQIGEGKSAIRYCLFMMTFSNNQNKVESFLDGTAKQVSKQDALLAVADATMINFSYLDAPLYNDSDNRLEERSDDK